MNNAKKIILSVAVVLVFGLYALYEYVWNPNSEAVIPPVVTDNGGTSAPSESINPSANPSPTPIPPPAGGSSPTPAPQSGYKDGTYTGDVADAFYGKLQVSVTIKSEKITDITYPVYPNSSGHTREVSNFALPALKSEAIAAQSANVDIVSGATQTSEAFRESLSAALAKAS